MFVQLLFLVVVFGLTYAYLNDQEQFTATASAIHQIWAGNCRLSCRQNGSRSDQTPCFTESSSNQYQTELNCICDSCPCGLVDELLGPYAPVRMNVVEVLSHYYYYGLEMVANGYNSLGSTTFGNLIPCERQAQFVSSDREGSVENFSFGSQPEKTTSRHSSTRKSPSLTTKKSEVSSSTKEGTSKSQKGSTSVTKVTSDNEKSDTNNCSRCVSQGKTCMKSCPKSSK